MDLIVVTPPAGQVITTAEVKARLAVSGTDDDVAIAAMIAAAQSALDGRDGMLGRALLTQTWKGHLLDFPGYGWTGSQSWIRLPLPPTSAVSEVAYLDANGTKVVVAGTDYIRAPGGWAGDVLIPKNTWPVMNSYTYSRPDQVQITFVAGYGAAASVPEPIKQAMHLLVGDMYAFRETAQVGSVSSQIQMTPDVDLLLAPYKVQAL
jgi:uncharacterized phiE125 gp8 family phage protein